MTPRKHAMASLTHPRNPFPSQRYPAPEWAPPAIDGERFPAPSCIFRQALWPVASALGCYPLARRCARTASTTLIAYSTTQTRNGIKIPISCGASSALRQLKARLK